MIARNKLVENGKGKYGRELSLKAMPLSFPWTLPNGNRPNGYYPDVEVDVDSSSIRWPRSAATRQAAQW
jgi:hypothetical protein